MHEQIYTDPLCVENWDVINDLFAQKAASIISAFVLLVEVWVVTIITLVAVAVTAKRIGATAEGNRTIVGEILANIFIHFLSAVHKSGPVFIFGYRGMCTAWLNVQRELYARIPIEPREAGKRDKHECELDHFEWETGRVYREQEIKTQGANMYVTHSCNHVAILKNRRHFLP